MSATAWVFVGLGLIAAFELGLILGLYALFFCIRSASKSIEAMVRGAANE